MTIWADIGREYNVIEKFSDSLPYDTIFVG